MNKRPINYDLERKLRRFAISDLIKYIVFGQGIVYALMLIWPSIGYQLYSLITLTRSGLMHGQIWRVITFVFAPPSSSPIFIIFSLYFYYIIGMGLEARWGKVKFNLYYLVGMAAAVIACLITGYASNSYLNLSLFFAYAAMYPDEEVLLFMLLPVKMCIRDRHLPVHRRQRLHARDHRAVPPQRDHLSRRRHPQYAAPREPLLEDALQLPQDDAEITAYKTGIPGRSLRMPVFCCCIIPPARAEGRGQSSSPLRP